VVEIVSPEQSANALVRRCLWYVANGVGIAVLVDPEDETVLLFRPDAVPLPVAGDEAIDLRPVLPDFRLSAGSCSRRCGQTDPGDRAVRGCGQGLADAARRPELAPAVGLAASGSNDRSRAACRVSRGFLARCPTRRIAALKAAVIGLSVGRAHAEAYHTCRGPSWWPSATRTRRACVRSPSSTAAAPAPRSATSCRTRRSTSSRSRPRTRATPSSQSRACAPASTAWSRSQ
jgi:hypothetical protein